MSSLQLFGRISFEKKVPNAEKIDSVVNSTILTNCWSLIRGKRLKGHPN